jgi:hypothetical protein
LPVTVFIPDEGLILKKALVSMSIATLLAANSSIPAQAQENLIYVPVNPCRIVDTRPGEGGEGAISAETSRNFLVSGDVSSQGGTSAGCESPRPGSTPSAISAYVVAVPVSGSTAGSLSAYPAGQTAPAEGEGATVNFAAGQVIGNTTNITLCEPDNCPTTGDTGEFAVLARKTIQHVIVDVQGYFFPAAGSCPDDMVAAGSICVDKYEASLVDAAGAPATSDTCNADGSDCGADAEGLNPAIFAQSVDGELPASSVSWLQAAVACANVDKRLPSAAEWQMAAAGTLAADCNVSGGVLATAGASPACVSTAGAFDMVGNLWEWTTDLRSDVTSGLTSVQTSYAAGFGESYNPVDPTPGTDSMFTPGSGTIAANQVFGFRCVR